ncbi:hypothetical protein L3Q72_08145 [Vibrio sp. JC009]|uniref:hypothetical protein n=1 Tax=Vibrio sp. JC009 TaxID=2912314 RepID=UPI0023AF9717|nr:hypothetical protein [Vibrio sp. JC009]WED20623.1 hypothetical protein L3Q72_08145 [Vibrio sp. JC009]
MTKGSKVSLAVIGLVSLATIFVASQFAVGSLYKIGLDNQIEVYSKYRAKYANSDDQAVSDKKLSILERLNMLKDNMLAWNQYNPEYLTYSAYVELVNSYSGESSEVPDSFVSQGLGLTQEAAKARPLSFKTYVQQAYSFNAKGDALQEALSQLYLAEQFGPYEKATARAGIDFYFGYWDKVSAKDRAKGVRYVLNPQQYGFNWGFSRGELVELLNGSSYKERVCQILIFSGKEPRVCQ